MTRIELDQPTGAPRAAVDGFVETDSRWALDLDQYGNFVESVTGIELHPRLSATECHRVGNRIEALIDEHRRRGDPDATLVAGHPEVESVEQVYRLARVFRCCHEQRSRDVT